MMVTAKSLAMEPSWNKFAILMVSTFPPDRDGIASYTAKLVKFLGNEGVKVIIAANFRNWKRNSPLYIFSILKKVIKSKANLVHVQLSYFTFGNEYYTGLFPFLVIFLRLLRRKLVVTFHDVVPKSSLKRAFFKRFTTPRFLGFKRLALIFFTKIVCSKVEKVIVHSELARDTLIIDYGVPQQNIRVIPHGIDKNPSFKEKPNVKTSSHPIVSYFGLVRNGKGLEDLIKAWRIVNDKMNVRLLIIGGKHPHLNDNCRNNLIKLVEELGLEDSIRFCGYVPNESLPKYLSETDVFVFPYKEWGDVIASSGALSVVAPYLKPMIATDVPAFYSLKKMGAAMIIKRGDISGLALAILKVLNDPKIKDLIAERLGNWLLERDWSYVAQKTVIEYRQFLDS